MILLGTTVEVAVYQREILMSLNIENEETHQLAIEARIRRLRAIRKRCARLLKAGGPSAVEHGDLLYDENGLPN